MVLKYSNSVLINLIIVSIIPFLIWGPFFPDLIVSVSSLLFLYYLLKKNDFYYFNKKNKAEILTIKSGKKGPHIKKGIIVAIIKFIKFVCKYLKLFIEFKL